MKLLFLFFASQAHAVNPGGAFDITKCVNPSIIEYQVTQRLSPHEFAVVGINWMSAHGIIKTKKFSLSAGQKMFPFYIKFVKTVKMQTANGFDTSVDLWTACEEGEPSVITIPHRNSTNH
jgi:hypothetical protein